VGTQGALPYFCRGDYPGGDGRVWDLEAG